jgi:hypothetical protein
MGLLGKEHKNVWQKKKKKRGTLRKRGGAACMVMVSADTNEFGKSLTNFALIIV